MGLKRQDKDRLWQLLSTKEHVSQPVLTVGIVLVLAMLFGVFGWNRLTEFRETEWVMAISPLTKWCHLYRHGVTGRVSKPDSVGLRALDHSNHECQCLTNPVYRVDMLTELESGGRDHYAALVKRSDFVRKRTGDLDQGWRYLLPGGAALPVGFNDPADPVEHAVMAWLDLPAARRPETAPLLSDVKDRVAAGVDVCAFAN